MALVYVVACLWASVIPVSGIEVSQQQTAPAARKFMEIGNERAEMEMARLDAFAEELRGDANLRGYLVVYSGGHFSPGGILRKVHGYLDRLINERGINPTHIEIIEAGQRGEYVAELWIVPSGSTFHIRPVAREKVNTPLMFDRVYYGVRCEPEVTVDLYQLEDGFKFWAKELSMNPHTRGWIVVNPKRGSSRRSALRVASRTKSILMRSYNIEGQRLTGRAGKWQDECSNIEFWIVPAGMVLSRATPNNGMHPTANRGALMRETCFNFKVRRGG